jgi:hypothetical protein
VSRNRGIGTAALLVLAALVAAAVFPGWRDRAIAFAVVTVFVFAVVTLLRAAARTLPPEASVFDEVAAPRKRPAGRPEDLKRLERLLGWKSYSKPEFDHRIGPLLRELTGYRLRASGTADLERDPQAARRHMSQDLWDIVTGPAARRDFGAPRTAPEGEHMSTEDMARLLGEIESL